MPLPQRNKDDIFRVAFRLLKSLDKVARSQRITGSHVIFHNNNIYS